MSFKKALGKSVVLLIIILILVVGGLLWFDRLGVIHVKDLFAPAYTLLHKDPQTSTTATQSKPFVANLDEDRLKKQREALDIYKEELDKRETNQEEREKTFNQTVKRYDDINVNVEQIAKNLNGMRPEAAVAILEALDDQTVIDVLRKVEELAAASGSSSMGSYWLSLMDSKRAAEIQRKMISKPESLE